MVGATNLPTHWKTVRMADIATIKYGKAKPEGTGNIPVVGSSGVYAYASRALVASSTLVIGRKGTAGTVWLQEEPCWPSDTTFYLDWTAEVTDIRFVYYYTSGWPLSGEHARTTLPSLQKPELENYVLPLPPLPEQRAIAHVLRTVQQAREARQREIGLERESKAALMQRLFTHGTRGEPRKQTEIGEMPENWKVVRLGEISRVSSGGTPDRSQPSYWNGSIPWVKTGEIDYNTIIETSEGITEEGLKNSSAKLYAPGTLLMAMYGQGVTRGRVALLGIDAAINQACAAIIASESVLSEYLFHLFAFSYDKIRNLGHGANQTNINALTRLL